MRFIGLLLAAVLLIPGTAWADTGDAYQVFSDARAATHQDGPFRLRGEAAASFNETVNGAVRTNKKSYRITGYGLNASETHLQFVTSETTAPVVTEFLIKPEGFYTKKTDWVPAEIITVLPAFISMGVLDQFFLLEILNSDRLRLYEDYISFGEDKKISGVTCRAVKASINKQQFAELAEALTENITELLGDAVKGMNALHLIIIQQFARGIFMGLDAEGSFTFYIHPTNGRIVQIETEMDIVNPYGSKAAGANPRVSSQAGWQLYDFGKAVKSVMP
jgi:hypothetical protein